jgi:hypothetical protein
MGARSAQTSVQPVVDWLVGRAHFPALQKACGKGKKPLRDFQPMVYAMA